LIALELAQASDVESGVGDWDVSVLIAAACVTFLGFLENPAVPMAIVIAGCAVASTLLNFLTLGPRLETAAQSDVLGAATRNAFRKWEHAIKRGLEHFGMKTDDAEIVATTVLSQLEGALLLARTYRNLEPIRRAEKAVKLLASARQSE